MMELLGGRHGRRRATSSSAWTAQSVRLIGTALAIVASLVNAEYYEGEGTAYTLGRTDAGNCNMMNANGNAGQLYAALNNEQWENTRHCGRCAEVSCADPRCTDTTTSVVVQLLDRCPECKFGDLDLSPSVFAQLTKSSPSRYRIKWRFADCPVEGNIKYCLKSGSNPFWTAIQPTNVVSGVKSLLINGKPTKMLGTAYYYLLDGQSQTQTDLSAVRVSLTSVNGETIEDTVSLADGSCTFGQRQFARGMGGGGTIARPSPPTTAPATDPPASQPRSVDSTSPPEITSPSPTVLDTGSSESANTTMPVGSGLDDAGRVSTPEDEDRSAVDTSPPTTSPSKDDTTTVNTQADAGDIATSPMIIILSSIGGVALVTLMVVIGIARKKKLDEKRRDNEAADRALVERVFASVSTPGNTSQAGDANIGVL